MFELGEIRKKLKGVKLLYVEDDVIIRTQLVKVLQKIDIEVHTANDGREGLQMALENQYSLIITDHIMPHMNGLEMIENLRKSELKVPIIIISAFNHQGFEDDCHRLDINSILVKPTSVNLLLDHLVQLLTL